MKAATAARNLSSSSGVQPAWWKIPSSSTCGMPRAAATVRARVVLPDPLVPRTTIRRESVGSCTEAEGATSGSYPSTIRAMADEVPPSSIVTRLVAVVFLQWLGATSVLPLLPLYLRQKGATPSTIGVVMASYFVAGVMFQFVAGRLSHSYGRKPALVAALFSYALSCLGFLLPLSPLAYGGMRFI